MQPPAFVTSYSRYLHHKDYIKTDGKCQFMFHFLKGDPPTIEEHVENAIFEKYCIKFLNFHQFYLHGKLCTICWMIIKKKFRTPVWYWNYTEMYHWLNRNNWRCCWYSGKVRKIWNGYVDCYLICIIIPNATTYFHLVSVCLKFTSNLFYFLVFIE
jgi:hypothetical protein